MGCICSKGASEEGNIDAEKEKGLAKSLSRLFTPTRRDEAVVPDSGTALGPNWNRSGTTSKLPESAVGSDEGQKKAVVVFDRFSVTVDSGPNGAGARGSNAEAAPIGIVHIAKGFEAEHIAAGWPSWLTVVAAEAIKGWLPRRADSFEKLDKIGQGTYSTVYRARDLKTGKMVALKKVRFVNMDPESVRFMAREIHILRKLDHPNVIKLEGIITSRTSSNLYLVFEYMEHDLAGLGATPGVKFTEPQVKLYMQQLLSGLDHCHRRGILHRDIKGSNLLIDNDGILRIADFGLATLFNPDQKQSLTSRVVTLWYRPPELLLGATEYDVGVDLWSAGCILAELLAGKPILQGRTEVEQLHKIFKLCGSPQEEYWRKAKLQNATIFKPQCQYPRRINDTFKDFPSSALVLLDSLLALEPTERGTAASALHSEFFTSEPLACDPSSLPKYPPSKEYHVKLRDEETRRQRAAVSKGQGSESRAKPIRNDHIELQQPQAQDNPKSTNEKYSPQGESGSGFLVEPPSTGAYGYSHTSTSMHPSCKAGGDSRTTAGLSSSTLRVQNGPQLRSQKLYTPQSGGGDVFNLTGTGSAKNRAYNRLDADDPSEKHMLDRTSSSPKKSEKAGSSTMGYGTKNKRIHYSGPLMPSGGNIEDMLKEHERQIQEAVRKARLDKTKTKKFF